MAIAVNSNISSGDIASVAATTTITLPSGTAATDVVVVCFGTDNNAATTTTVTAPAGWTRIDVTVAGSNGTTRVKQDVFWALGNVSNLGFTNSNTGATFQQGWVCLGWTGVDNTTPIDATGTSNTNASAANITTNAVTVATDQAWHVIAVTDWLGKVAYTATSFTEKNNAAANAAAAILYNTTPKSVGSTGTVVVNNSDGTTTGEILNATPFALRPAADASSTLWTNTVDTGTESAMQLWNWADLY